MTGDDRSSRDEMDEFDLRDLATLARWIGIYPRPASTRLLIIVEVCEGEYQPSALPPKVLR